MKRRIQQLRHTGPWLPNARNTAILHIPIQEAAQPPTTTWRGFSEHEECLSPDCTVVRESEHRACNAAGLPGHWSQHQPPSHRQLAISAAARSPCAIRAYGVSERGADLPLL